MAMNLIDLLKVTDDILKRNNIEFWLNCGILLGYIRNNQLLSQDYDLDVIINSDDYEKIMSLQSQFNNLGYTLYGKNNYMPYTFFGKLLKRYLTCVSIRLYNNKTHYYLEFYESYVVEGYNIKKVKQKYPDVILPNKINDNSSYVCTGRQDNYIDSTDFCYYYNDVYPLHKVNAFPENLSLLIPNNPHEVLIENFGKDYLIPKSKGYKWIICIIYLFDI